MDVGEVLPALLDIDSIFSASTVFRLYALITIVLSSNIRMDFISKRTLSTTSAASISPMICSISPSPVGKPLMVVFMSMFEAARIVKRELVFIH